MNKTIQLGLGCFPFLKRLIKVQIKSHFSEYSSSLLSLAIFTCAPFIEGCIHVRGHISEALPISASGVTLAGAAEEDITPFPGYPMAGHSIAGETSRGVWTRLYARAVYIEDSDGRSMVLVSCDLLGIPGGLADRVAEIVSASKRGRHIGREQIVLAATHTHHGPGGFFTSALYNQYASPSKGFDCNLFELLAKKTANAILQAASNKSPVYLSFATRTIEGLSRNRSFDAFVLNPESRVMLQDNSWISLGPTSLEYPCAEAYRAIDPSISILKVTKVDDGTVMSVVGFVAVHATALGHDAEVYQSDLYGVAATVLERHLRSASPKAQVCIFNGAEGDVSPCWDDHQDRRSVLKMGLRLASGMESLVEKAKPLGNPVRIKYQFKTAKLASREFRDDKGYLRRTSDKALAGVATLGGAEDGRTVFYHVGYYEGIHGARHGDQGDKQPAFDPKFVELPISISTLAMMASPPPTEVPLGVYSIGPLVFGTLPGEFTTVMGKRVAAAIVKACPFNASQVLLIGLANEYVSYITTPEEYEAQDYEGASTLYGPASGPLIQSELSTLAQHLNDEPTHLRGHDYCYSPGSGTRFGAKLVGQEPYEFDDGVANILQDLNDGYPIRTYPHYEWEEKRLAPNIEPESIPQVRIEFKQDAAPWAVLPSPEGGYEDSSGIHIVTILLQATSSSLKWCAIWMPENIAAGPKFRFSVRGGSAGNNIFSSPEFDLPN